MTKTPQDTATATETVTIDWLDDTKHTILVTYQKDGWSWDDFHRVVDEQHKLVASVAHTVDVLVDVRKTNWLPKGGSLSSGIRKINNIHERQGSTVVVGASGVIAIIARSMMKLVGGRSKFQFVTTMDDAHALLTSIRERRAKTT